MLPGKVVVITGASSGIGAHTAILAAKQGAIPILLGRSQERLKEVSQRIAGKHEVRVMDVSSEEDVHFTMNSIFHTYQRIDILVNNAGFGIFKTADALSMKEFEQMMNVNYLGLVRCTKAVLPFMIQLKKGHIINIASIAGKLATMKSSGYAATKFAVLGFTNALRMELRQYGINVSAVHPGPIDTPFLQLADPTGQYRASLMQTKRFFLQPDDVAQRIVKLMIRPKREMTLPTMAVIPLMAYSLFPSIFEKCFFNILNKK